MTINTTSAIKTTQPYIPPLDDGEAAKISGVPYHFATAAAMQTAVTTERANIALGLPRWTNGSHLTNAEEVGYRAWFKDTVGADDAAKAAASHARNAVLSGGYTLTLAGDTNTVTATTGAPSGGNNGDRRVDRTAGLLYTRTSGAWDAGVSIGGSTDLTPVNAAIAALPTKLIPAGTIVGVGGDSIAAFGDGIAAGGTNLGPTSQSIPAHASARLPGSPLDLKSGYNRAVGGTTWIDVLNTQVPQLLADPTNIVWLHCGVNDTNPSVDSSAPTVAQVIQRARRVVEALAPFKDAILLDSISPSSSATISGSAPRKADHVLINAGYQAIADEFPNVIYIDTWTPLIGTGNDAAAGMNVASDGLHLSTKGAMTAGFSAATTLRKTLALRHAYSVVSTSALPNFTGTTGTKTPGSGTINGNVPAGCNVAVVTGNATVTVSPSTPNSNACRLVITGPTSGTSVIRFQFADYTTFAPGYVSGDIVRSRGSLSVAAGQTGLYRANITFQLNPSGTFVNVDAISKSTMENGSGGTSVPVFPTTAYTEHLSTPAYTLTANATTINTVYSIEINTGGSVTIDVFGWGMEKVVRSDVTAVTAAVATNAAAIAATKSRATIAYLGDSQTMSNLTPNSVATVAGYNSTTGQLDLTVASGAPKAGQSCYISVLADKRWNTYDTPAINAGASTTAFSLMVPAGLGSAPTASAIRWGLNGRWSEYGIVGQVQALTGGRLNVLRVAGMTGETTAQIFDRVSELSGLNLGRVVVQFGHNDPNSTNCPDSATAVTYANSIFASAVTGITALLAICPKVTVITMTPFGSGHSANTVPIRAFIVEMNRLIKTLPTTHTGVSVADAYSAIVDQAGTVTGTTGAGSAKANYLQSDNIHWAGKTTAAIAGLVATVINAEHPPLQWLPTANIDGYDATNNPSAFNRQTNPTYLIATGGSAPSGAATGTTATGAAVSVSATVVGAVASVVAATAANAVGNAQKIVWDSNAAGDVVQILSTNQSARYAPGQKVKLRLRVKTTGIGSAGAVRYFGLFISTTVDGVNLQLPVWGGSINTSAQANQADLDTYIEGNTYTIPSGSSLTNLNWNFTAFLDASVAGSIEVCQVVHSQTTQAY